MTDTMIRPERATQPKKNPKYNVVLWDSDLHSYGYCRRMIQELFRYNEADANRKTEEVDREGRVTLLTTSKEHAELKRDQIHAYGIDKDMIEKGCKGSMSATIEEAE